MLSLVRPERAKALIINAFALSGRVAFINPYTQGKRSDTLRIIVLSLVRPERAKALIIIGLYLSASRR